MDVVHRQTERIPRMPPKPTEAVEKRVNPFKVAWQTHVILMLLAGLIWWMASQRVSETKVLRDGAKLEAIIEDGKLAQEWAVVSARMFADLRLSGPHNELVRFEEELEGRDRALYRLVITSSMLEGKSPSADNRLEVTAPLERFELISPDFIPGEVQVAYTDPKREIVVRLEKYIRANPRFDQSGIKVPRDYDARIEVREAINVSGLWSGLKPHADDTGSVVIKFAPFDLEADIARATAQLDATAREQFMQLPIERTLPLLPIDGAAYLSEKGEPVARVSAAITLTAKAAYTEMTRTIPLTVSLPMWFIERRAEVSSIVVGGAAVRELPLRLRVDPRQSAAFSAENVRLIVDMASLTQEKLMMEPPKEGQPNVRTGVLKRVPVRLDANKQKLDYRLPTAMSGDIYHEADVTISWRE